MDSTSSFLGFSFYDQQFHAPFGNHPISETPPKFRLDLTIHKHTKKVILAETDNDFIEFLISLLKQPVGDFLLSSHHHLMSETGVQNIANSLSNIDLIYNNNDVPNHVIESLFSSSRSEYAAGKRFAINDNLVFKPFSGSSYREFIIEAGVKNLNFLEDKTVFFGLDEALKLINQAVHKDVLTSVFRDILET